MKHKLFSLQCWFYDFVKVTSAIPGLIWFRPKWIYENREAKKRIRGGALLAANHQSQYDPVSLQFAIGYRRQRFVCLKSFFEKPILNWLFSHFLCIPVERENASVQTFKDISSMLLEGWVVSIFPEGRISEGMGTFKSGIIMMSIMGKSPIVPVYIGRKKHWYSRLRLVIGEAIDPLKLYGQRPNLAQIEEVTRLLKEREEILEKLCQK